MENMPAIEINTAAAREHVGEIVVAVIVAVIEILCHLSSLDSFGLFLSDVDQLVSCGAGYFERVIPVKNRF